MEGVEKRLFVAGEPEPVVAWVPPGHFVLLDEMGAGWVRVWDPDGNGPGQPSVKRQYRDEWTRRWDGTALVFGQAPAGVLVGRSGSVPATLGLRFQPPDRFSVRWAT